MFGPSQRPVVESTAQPAQTQRCHRGGDDRQPGGDGKQCGCANAAAERSRLGAKLAWPRTLASRYSNFVSQNEPILCARDTWPILIVPGHCHHHGDGKKEGQLSSVPMCIAFF